MESKKKKYQKKLRIERGLKTYPEFLLPLWCHETLLGFLGLGGFLHALAHLSPLTVDLRLLGLLRLETNRKLSVTSSIAREHRSNSRIPKHHHKCPGDLRTI